MRSASIFKIPNKGYIIFGESKTVTGFSIASEPYFHILESEAHDEIIVQSIKAALCNDDAIRVSDPADWKQSDKDFLKKIGLKSMKELDNPFNKYIAVTENELRISFTPSRPADKPDKGFLHKAKSEAVLVNSNAPNEEIIEALEQALTRCG